VIIVDRAAELTPHIGAELGASRWITVSQQDVLTFADITHDGHWLHTDVDRAARETQYGGVLVQGFLLLALLTDLGNQCYEVRAATRWLNYGLDQVRFTAPVRPGDQLRLRLTLNSTSPTGAATRLTPGCTLELRGSERPAAVATWIVIVIEEDAA